MAVEWRRTAEDVRGDVDLDVTRAAVTNRVDAYAAELVAHTRGLRSGTHHQNQKIMAAHILSRSSPNTACYGW